MGNIVSQAIVDSSKLDHKFIRLGVAFEKAVETQTMLEFPHIHLIKQKCLNMPISTRLDHTNMGKMIFFGVADFYFFLNSEIILIEAKSNLKRHLKKAEEQLIRYSEGLECHYKIKPHKIIKVIATRYNPHPDQKSFMTLKSATDNAREKNNRAIWTLLTRC